MATINLTATNIQAIQAGVSKIVTTPPINNLVAPDNTPFVSSIVTIDQDVASIAKANTPGSTALPTPPNNFRFFDATVQVSGQIPGDMFKGTTPGVTAQFIDLTPDNIGITGLNPNLLMLTDTGNDVLSVVGGRNILAAGSGTDTFIGGTGVGSVDTFIGDASKASITDTIFNFHSGDNAAMLGVDVTDFTFALTDTVLGLQISATPNAPAAGAAQTHNAASITLAGFSTSDIGSKLSLGINSVAPTPYLFIHGT